MEMRADSHHLMGLLPSIILPRRLKSMHPRSPPSTSSVVPSTPLSLGTDFNIVPTLLSFPKGWSQGLTSH